MNRDEAIRMLRDAYRHILHMRSDELGAYVWARTLGTLWQAKEQVHREGVKP